MKVNETITLNDKTGLEIDFDRITYKDAAHSGPTWFTAHIPPADVRRLCGKDGTGFYEVTEDELETALYTYLAETLASPVANFRWQWDTFRQSNVA